MTRLLSCRRTFVGLVAIVCLTFIGYHKGIDVSMAIAAISAGLSASNAWEGKQNGPKA